jgi:hypothetical protein
MERRSPSNINQWYNPKLENIEEKSACKMQEIEEPISNTEPMTKNRFRNLMFQRILLISNRQQAIKPKMPGIT